MPRVEGVAENWTISFSVWVFSFLVCYFWSIVDGSRAAAWPVACLGAQCRSVKGLRGQRHWDIIVGWLFLLGSLPVVKHDSLSGVNLSWWGWAYSNFGVGWKAPPGIFHSPAACVRSGSSAQLLCDNLACCRDNVDAHTTSSSRPWNI